MFQFVYWLKALAAVLITNSHYADIWPVSAMATGGHLGNCLFFLVSGFCMHQIRDSFPKWYMKRIVRIYPALWVAIVFNWVTGFFTIGSVSELVRCFVYPTRYHFIASIMILYILFWIVRKIQGKWNITNHQVLILSVIAGVAVYLFVFDKSWYHVDAVEENWVRFQFWISMMLGVSLRERYESMDEQISTARWIGTGVLLVIYFAAKTLVSRYEIFYAVQILSPVSLVVLVYHIAVLTIKMEKRSAFTTLGRWNKIIGLVASMTLEIYLVQNVIIYSLHDLLFPVNFAVVTALILIVAWIVHQGTQRLQKCISNLIHL